MLMMDGDDSDYWSSDYDEEGAGDELDHVAEGGGSIEGSDDEVDAAYFENDEAYSRALQDAEERVLAVRLMALAGLNECESLLITVYCFLLASGCSGTSIDFSRLSFLGAR